MKKKKLLLLGGSRYLLTVIETCHRLGHEAITCDFLPDNIAHQYSDSYYNVSIVDKDAIFALAQRLKIDGIMSFACDPGVVTASYVAEKMGLPFQGSYESNRILQDKGLFRKFLWDNGFNSPHAKSYQDKAEALKDVDFFTWPVIVKPVDSAGSKGVTRVDTSDKLSEAIDTAMASSIGKSFIIEDFLTFDGFHSSADDFTVNGQLKFCTYSDQLFDKEADNPYTPAFIIWPSSMRLDHQEYLTKETQRLMSLLDMRTGIYNIESCVGADGKPYLMEVSSRGGGCKIADIQKLASGIDLIEAEVRKALGEEIGDIRMPRFDGVWCEMVIHNGYGQQGVYKGLTIDPQVKDQHVKMIDLSVKEGDFVEPFTGANKALGDMFLQFDTREELDDALARVHEWMKIDLA